MRYGERAARGFLAGRVYSLSPDTAKGVALGEKINQATVRGPGGAAIHRGTVGNSNPFELCHLFPRTERRHVKRAGIRTADRLESDPPLVRGKLGRVERELLVAQQHVHLARGSIERGDVRRRTGLHQK